jgi:hypothetical protein
MKIYVLLMLIGIIVGVSYLPVRRQAKAVAHMPADATLLATNN